MDLSGFVAALRVGGAMIYPLLLLAVIAVVVILEKAFVFSTRLACPLRSSRSSRPTPSPGKISSSASARWTRATTSGDSSA